MTQPEQDAASGNLVKTFSDAKQKRAALLSELHKIGVVLKSFGYVVELHQLEYLHGQPYPKVPGGYPSAEHLAAPFEGS